MKIYFSNLEELQKFKDQSKILNDRYGFSLPHWGNVYNPILYNLHWHSDDSLFRYFRIYKKK